MKVSDRQWRLNDVLRLIDDRACIPRTVIEIDHQDRIAPVRVEHGGETEWLNSHWEVMLVAEAPRQEKLPVPTIEQRAVRLAEVYNRAQAAAESRLDGPSRFNVAHDIAMLLVKRELEAGDG